MNANVKCFILCIYKTILKPSKQFLTVSNHKVFSLHALWMTILRPSGQLLTDSNHQVFRFYTLLKLSKVFHPSICSSFVLNLRWLLLRVSRWITNMLVLSKYLLTVTLLYLRFLKPNKSKVWNNPQRLSIEDEIVFKKINNSKEAEKNDNPMISF